MSLPPKVGTPLVQNICAYWSLKHEYVYVVPYELHDADNVPLVIEQPVELIVTEDVLAKIAAVCEAQRIEAHKKYMERVEELNKIQSRYLAIEMSPTEE